RRNELSGNAVLDDLGEDRADVTRERLRVLAGGERNGRIGDPGLGEWIERKVRLQCFALWHETEEREASTVEDVREHLERSEIGAVEPGCPDREHGEAVRLIGAQAERGGMRRSEPYLGARRQLLRPDVAKELLHLEQGAL